MIDFDGLSGSYNGLVKAIEKDKDSVGATEAEVADAMLKMVDRGVKCKDSKIKDPKTKKSKDIWPKGISPGQRQAAMAILVSCIEAQIEVPTLVPIELIVGLFTPPPPSGDNSCC